jgi:secreted trypsin-like serine protease
MQNDALPSVLRYVEVPYLKREKCIELAEKYNTAPPPPDHICFAPMNSPLFNASSCVGDSGGPTVLNAFKKEMQVSLTSYGPGNYKCGGTKNILSIDTSVAFWRNWIDDILSLYNLNGQSRKNTLVEERCMTGKTFKTTTAATAGACCDKCRGNSGCKAWTWSSTAEKCVLKSSKGSQTLSSICTSGYF